MTFDSEPTRPMQYQIPKRIIQIGKSATLPLRNQALMKGVRLLNPEYEYLFFDNEQQREFVVREFPRHLSVFDSFPFIIQRCDFFRYLAIYRYGGFYFDADVLLASSLSDLLRCGCVFPFEAITVSRFLRNNLGMDWQIGNYAFGAAPGHAFLEAIIENCVRGYRDPNWVKTMMRGSPPLLEDEFLIINSTGPGLVSRTLAENPALAKTVTVLFPENVCDVRTWNRFGEWGIHLMESSWRPNKSFIRRKFSGYCWRWIQHSNIKQAIRIGKSRYHPSTRRVLETGLDETRIRSESVNPIPLVSILIPAYNAEKWIADTIRSALAQTWQRKEIIIVDDGSTDHTLAIAQQFESDSVKVASQENLGAAKARNKAFSLSQGDYIQWLDADDLLAPDKIEKQMEASNGGSKRRTLFSSGWGLFMYRYCRAKFVPTSLWCDLPKTEWLLRKMGQNLHMPTATWLVSRELAEAAGNWNTALCTDDDGEYFCRVLLASDGVRFVPEAKIYYRFSGSNSVSYIGGSDRKRDAQWLSMKLHMAYLRSLEDSDRTRAACVTYIQNWLIHFYPDRRDIIKQAEQMAEALGGQLRPPLLAWKYSWIRAIFGWRLAKRSQLFLRNLKWSSVRLWDKALFRIAGRRHLISS
ncbi:MAG: glycosyltransferase [Terriglobales bacterium]